jgi:hypothetical protein
MAGAGSRLGNAGARLAGTRTRDQQIIKWLVWTHPDSSQYPLLHNRFQAQSYWLHT